MDFNSQLSRMKDLMTYGGQVCESAKPIKNYTLEYKAGAADGKTYGIIKENQKYYIKYAENGKETIAEAYQYIGGFNNKKDYEYNSYAKALKNFEMKLNSINEANDSEARINTINPFKKNIVLENATQEMHDEIARQRQIMYNASMLMNESTAIGATPFKNQPEAERANSGDEDAPFTQSVKADMEFDGKSSSCPKCEGEPFDCGDKKCKSSKKGKDVQVKDSVAGMHPAGGKVVRVNEGYYADEFLRMAEKSGFDPDSEEYNDICANGDESEYWGERPSLCDYDDEGFEDEEGFDDDEEGYDEDEDMEYDEDEENEDLDDEENFEPEENESYLGEGDEDIEDDEDMEDDDDEDEELDDEDEDLDDEDLDDEDLDDDEDEDDTPDYKDDLSGDMEDDEDEDLDDEDMEDSDEDDDLDDEDEDLDDEDMEDEDNEDFEPEEDECNMMYEDGDETEGTPDWDEFIKLAKKGLVEFTIKKKDGSTRNCNATLNADRALNTLKQKHIEGADADYIRSAIEDGLEKAENGAQMLKMFDFSKVLNPSETDDNFKDGELNVNRCFITVKPESLISVKGYIKAHDARRAGWDAEREEKKEKLDEIAHRIAKKIIKEETLNVWGQHPGYRKKPMTLMTTGSDTTPYGKDWNHSSVHNEIPFGTSKGNSKPYANAYDSKKELAMTITNKIMNKITGKKSPATAHIMSESAKKKIAMQITENIMSGLKKKSNLNEYGTDYIKSKAFVNSRQPVKVGTGNSGVFVDTVNRKINLIPSQRIQLERANDLLPGKMYDFIICRPVQTAAGTIVAYTKVMGDAYLRGQVVILLIINKNGNAYVAEQNSRKDLRNTTTSYNYSMGPQYANSPKSGLYFACKVNFDSIYFQVTKANGVTYQKLSTPDSPTPSPVNGTYTSPVNGAKNTTPRTTNTYGAPLRESIDEFLDGGGKSTQVSSYGKSQVTGLSFSTEDNKWQLVPGWRIKTERTDDFLSGRVYIFNKVKPVKCKAGWVVGERKVNGDWYLRGSVTLQLIINKNGYAYIAEKSDRSDLKNITSYRDTDVSTADTKKSGLYKACTIDFNVMAQTAGIKLVKPNGGNNSGGGDDKPDTPPAGGNNSGGGSHSSGGSHSGGGSHSSGGSHSGGGSSATKTVYKNVSGPIADFQSANGLNVDGIVGDQTKLAALKWAAKNSDKTNGEDDPEKIINIWWDYTKGHKGELDAANKENANYRAYSDKRNKQQQDIFNAQNTVRDSQAAVDKAQANVDTANDELADKNKRLAGNQGKQDIVAARAQARQDAGKKLNRRQERVMNVKNAQAGVDAANQNLTASNDALGKLKQAGDYDSNVDYTQEDQLAENITRRIMKKLKNK